MTTPPPPKEGDSAFLPPPSSETGQPSPPPPTTSDSGPPSSDTPTTPSNTPTDAIPSPRTEQVFRHTIANEETTVLTPVTAPTNLLDRIPLTERKRLMLLAGGAGIFAVLLLAFTMYLLVINNQWQTRTEALTVEAYDLGERLTDANGQIVEKQAQIDLLGDQLETAQGKVLDLADEMAQVGDDSTYIQQQLDLYRNLASLGGTTSLALNRCVNEYGQLVDYLKDPGAWDPESLAAYEESVRNDICQPALNANATLQKTLTE